MIVPLPVCLRNSLAFTLPIPAESTSNSPPPQWDLAVKPYLRSSSSSTPPGDADGPTTITGLFASTSALSIRWTPRRAYSVMLPESSLDVAWGIGENGWGRVTVKGEAQIEYAGLKDKTWVELKVDHGAGGLSESSTRAFEVLSLEGEGILASEVAREALAPVSPQPPRHPRLAREPSSEYTTPTPRPRPAAAHLQDAQSRPPSYTNLFDTAPPIAPELDPALVARMAEPSLLSQAAPFEGDASMDMTFETSSSDGEDEESARLLKSRLGTAEENVDGGGSATSSPEAPEADSDWPQAQLPFPTTTTIRLQLNLAALLVPEKLPTPTLRFELKADFPTITLRALSSAFYPSPEPYAFRLALPTFSLPAAVHEDTVVSVSAGVGGSVEVLASDPMLKGAVGTDSDSPLPATNGRARWRTERSQDDGNPHRRSRSSSDLVEVEVSLPPSRPTSLIQLDKLGDSDEFSPSPSPAVRSPSRIRSLHRGQTPSLRSLRSKSSAHSLGLNLASAPLALAPTLGRLKLRITPVPPPLDSPTQPWRLFTHLTFPRPFVGSFELPMGEEQRVEVCDSWDAQGEAVLVESETLVEDGRSGSGSGSRSGSASGSKRMRVDTTGSSRQSSPVLRRKGEAEAEVEGVHELLYVVETSQKGQDGKIELGDVLPKMDLKVSSMEVEVLPVAGELRSRRPVSLRPLTRVFLRV